MGAMVCQITSLAIVYSTVYSGADQRKHQSSGSLTFVRGIHRWITNILQVYFIGTLSICRACMMILNFAHTQDYSPIVNYNSSTGAIYFYYFVY